MRLAPPGPLQRLADPLAQRRVEVVLSLRLHEAPGEGRDVRPRALQVAQDIAVRSLRLRPKLRDQVIVLPIEGELPHPDHRAAVELVDLGRQPAELFERVVRGGQHPGGVVEQQGAQPLELTPHVHAPRGGFRRHLVEQ